MTRRSAILVLFPVLIATGLSTPAPALGDGLPVVGVDAGSTGPASSAGTDRYVALPADRGTVVARVDTDSGRVLRSRAYEEGYTIPAVAYDGSGSGLSHDGGTLVLIDPRVAFPRKDTRLEILDALRLKPRETVDLDGDFSFDAISPDGATMYLIEYLSKRDPTEYAVRAYDLDSGELLADPIVDPSEPDEEMRGQPITRLHGPDGRWAYTLYDGLEHPFVHALDTVDGRAICIDLDALNGRRDLYSLSLEQTGGDLTVMDGTKPLSVIDTTTFEVSAPAAALATGANWPRLAAISSFAAAVAALVVVTYRRRRARSVRLAPSA